LQQPPSFLPYQNKVFTIRMKRCLLLPIQHEWIHDSHIITEAIASDSIVQAVFHPSNSGGEMKWFSPNSGECVANDGCCGQVNNK
jgi:hypothetical protein